MLKFKCYSSICWTIRSKLFISLSHFLFGELVSGCINSEYNDNGIYEAFVISLHVSILNKVTMTDPNYHSHCTEETEALQPGHGYIAFFSKYCMHTFPMCSQLLAGDLGHGCLHQIHKEPDAVMLADLFRATMVMPAESNLHGDYKI